MNRLLAALTALACFFSSSAQSTTLPATPANLLAQIAAAQPGDIVQVSGVLGDTALKAIVKAAPGVTIDLGAASLQGQLGLYGSAGLVIAGPHCQLPPAATPPGTLWNCIVINTSANIVVRDGTFSGAVTGISVQQSNRVTITGNTFHMANDGVDAQASQFVDFERNACLAAQPSAGHADCFQVWSIAGQPLSSDITIAWNTAVGYLQGFDGDGSPLTLEGIARVNLHDNVYAGTMATAGGFQPCSACQMANNVAFTLTVTPNAAPSWGMACAPYGAGAVMAVSCAPADAPAISGNVNGPKFQAAK